MGVNALEVRRRVMLAQPHEAEASGAVASFRTDVISPLKMQFDLLPIQNLNGQANPYPPGGGKNLFDQDNADWVTGKYINASGVVGNNGQYKYTEAYTPVNASTQYAISCTKLSSDNVLLTVCFYDSEKTFIERVQAIDFGSGTGRKSGTFTTTSETAFIRFSTVYNSTNGGSTDFQIELGNATDYAPYSNICPITGHDGFTRTGTGGNLLPTFTETPTVPGLTITVNDGAITISGTISSTKTIYAPFGVFIWDGVTDCWLSGCPAGGNYLTSYSLRVDGSSASAYSAPDTGTGVRLMKHQGAASSIIGIQLRYCIVLRAGTYNNLTFTPMLNFGLSAQKYSPYSIETYTTTFPTPPGTVYGGHVKDNGDGTGTLVVTDKYYVFDGDEDWFIAATGTNRVFRFNEAFPDYIKASTLSPYISNWAIPTTVINNVENGGFTQWVYRTTATSTNKNLLVVTPTSDVNMTLDSFKAMLEETPLEICAKLFTPVSYTLPLDIIQSLIGQNNVWVDNADSVSVEYWGH